ncbi:MAG: cold-shock protein [Candidatus Marinimicrobia bacterium]|nr:cold-shock protein [Candidatus Neomarinimicrobiota bacterium]|tara:strand:- start:1529 stop:1717 length:189 start_codon:yes stop_codon:yes gene_type:complete
MNKEVVKGFDINKGSSFITNEDNEDYFVDVSGSCEYQKCRLKSIIKCNFRTKGDKDTNMRIN